MAKDAAKDSKSMEQDFVQNTKSMKDSATSTSKKMADQMISDYNRIKTTYSRSISTNVTINQRTVKSTVNAQSDDFPVQSRAINPALFSAKNIDSRALASNIETRARGFATESQQVINSVAQNRSFDRYFKASLTLCLKKVKDYHATFI